MNRQEQLNDRIAQLESALLRQLTDKERLMLGWLSDRPKEVNEVIYELMEAMRKAGQADANPVFPRQPEKQNGWSVSTEFIYRVSEWIDANADANAPSMEDIENVLLAVENLKR
ncbi:hypothetical protein ABEV00_21990 [Paenibacillus thiaminolyticus]|uniref:hypothetical protein n=1 Tax=Paenibacillus thiaminolyticus TaxID=49283 RepID=UPI003D2A2D43